MHRPRLLRVPLPVRLMFSYVLVVGLVLLPIVLYLRRILEEELHGAVVQHLGVEAERLAERLAAVPPEREAALLELIAEAVPDRVTVMRPDGTVVADSDAPAAELENHGNRPEVVAALHGGWGVAERPSATVGQTLTYVARRYPAAGPPRGIVRVSVPTSRGAAILGRGRRVLDHATAIALSGAVLLSLIVALIVSRKVGRIARAMRAYAAGDFGHRLELRGNDELADTADALRELAARLRTTLVAAGSERATLESLLDGLPCGVILFDADGTATTVSGPARVLCDLQPPDERERVARIAELTEQRNARERALLDREPADAPLLLPWSPHRSLQARWVCLSGPDGRARAALVIIDVAADDRLLSLQHELEGTTALLREAAAAASGGGDLALRASLEQEADRLQTALAADRGSEDDADAPWPIELERLCATATERVRARAAIRKVKIRVELPERPPPVVESGGRTCQAVCRLLDTAIRSTKKGSSLLLRGELNDAHVRLSVQVKGRVEDTSDIDDPVRSLGGEARTKNVGDETMLRLELPLA